jgi:hypothetical protein
VATSAFFDTIHSYSDPRIGIKADTFCIIFTFTFTKSGVCAVSELYLLRAKRKRVIASSTSFM